MARKLRKGRVALAIIILVGIVFGISMLIHRLAKKGEGNEDNKGHTEQQAMEQQGEAAKSDSPGGQEGAAPAPAAPQWPSELNGIAGEYTGAGELISSEKTADDKGKTLYSMKYKGTSIGSCFDYSKTTLKLSGEWTEEITGELYTYSRETEKFLVHLRCEPKAQNGYDFLISFKIK